MHHPYPNVNPTQSDHEPILMKIWFFKRSNCITNPIRWVKIKRRSEKNSGIDEEEERKWRTNGREGEADRRGRGETCSHTRRIKKLPLPVRWPVWLCEHWLPYTMLVCYSVLLNTHLSLPCKGKGQRLLQLLLVSTPSPYKNGRRNQNMM